MRSTRRNVVHQGTVFRNEALWNILYEFQENQGKKVPQSYPPNEGGMDDVDIFPLSE